MSATEASSTREEKIERWVTLDVAGLLLSHVSGLLEDGSLGHSRRPSSTRRASGRSGTSPSTG